MHTKTIYLLILLLWSSISFASGEHSGEIFHTFKLQADYGDGRDDSISRWDLDGWIGGDERKLWLKSEGENVAGTTERNETWALYSHNIDTFWDAQTGFRYDNKPESIAYFVLGFNGLAPYFFETEAHLFVSDEGDVSLRLREENDFLITQKLILKPYGEININPGNSDGEIGLQLRYEITRKFSPYFDLRHTRSDDGEDFITSVGLQLIF